MKIRDISISTCLALLLMGCVAKPPMATESEMKEAAAFAFNVDASQVTISDAKQQDVKTNFVQLHHRQNQPSMLCDKSRRAETLRADPTGRRQYRLGCHLCRQQPDASEQNLRRPVEKSGPLLSLCAGEGR